MTLDLHFLVGFHFTLRQTPKHGQNLGRQICESSVLVIVQDCEVQIVPVDHKLVHLSDLACVFPFADVRIGAFLRS